MKKYNLTQGNVRRILLFFALPYLAANVLQALYGATDLFVVGRYNTPSAISAVNIGSQIMQIITSFVIGCSMGCTVMTGKYIGENEGGRSAKVFGSTVLLFAVFAVVITPVMIGLAPCIVRLMQTPGEALSEATTYVAVCAIGIPFIIIFNVTAAILRGMGDSKTPMIIVAIACVINVGGDFLLTGLLKMGVLGVAIATSSAQLISSLVGVILMLKRKFPFAFCKKDLHPDKEECRNILKVGLPIALQDTLINISFIILTVIANLRSLISSSAVGVVEKLILFMFLVPSSMLSAISAFTAQNIGAKKPERALSATKFGMLITAIFGVIMCALSWICPQILTGIFSKDTQVIAEANEYLKTYSIDCILVAITFCINGYLCGQGKSNITFAHNVISIFLVRIPAAYALSKTFPATMPPMGLASPLGSVASIVILCIYFKKKNQPDNCR
ncbi:MAG: MATE family efflux transporter [Treponema sp.]|nr:MATE family efflux transporter [Treponema sp.]